MEQTLESLSDDRTGFTIIPFPPRPQRNAAWGDWGDDDDNDGE